MRIARRLRRCSYPSLGAAGRDLATWRGRPIWIGAYDALDGKILEAYSYAQARQHDFHHSMYFSPEVTRAIAEGAAGVFWIEPTGEIETMWRDDGAAPWIRHHIASQLVR